jgi:hypothetical protein
MSPSGNGRDSHQFMPNHQTDPFHALASMSKLAIPVPREAATLKIKRSIMYFVLGVTVVWFLSVLLQAD